MSAVAWLVLDLLHEQHDLALRCAVHSGVQGVVEVLELICLNPRAQLAGLHEARELREHGGALLDRRVLGPLAEPEALERDVVEDERARAHGHGLLAHAAVRDVHALLGQHLGHVQAGLAAHAVERELGGRQVRDELLELGRAGVVGGAHDGGAQALQVLHGLLVLAVVADDVDGLDAPQSGQLDHGLAHGAVGAVLDHHVALVERREVGQHAVGRGRVHGQRGRVLHLDLVRNLHDGGAVGHSLAAPGACNGTRQEPLATCNTSLNILTPWC
ncbi:hypothetical protein ON010_g4376 [Phytophthora cinnamomi]|nr:hypothetical protein ON010_g4376 [Phytophthora cinnamomi]